MCDSCMKGASLHLAMGALLHRGACPCITKDAAATMATTHHDTRRCISNTGYGYRNFGSLCLALVQLENRIEHIEGIAIVVQELHLFV